MLSSADPIAKIQQYYMDGRWEVPYLTFMGVFNELLEDPVAVKPKQPSSALREAFRACCMAVNVGVTDREGRGDERVAEFRDSVLPVWRKAMPPEQFARYEDILSGQMRQRAQDERGAAVQEPGPEIEDEDEDVTGEVETPTPGSAKASALLRRLGIASDAEQAEPPAGGAPAAPAAETPQEAATREAATGEFSSVDALVMALRSGAKPIEYAPRGVSGEFAHYAMDDLTVTVRLAEAEDRTYTVLTARVGHGDDEEAGAAVTDLAADLGYVRIRDFAYIRETEDLVYTLKMGPDTTSIACATSAAAEDETVVLRIQRSHRDLGELVERLQH